MDHSFRRRHLLTAGVATLLSRPATAQDSAAQVILHLVDRRQFALEGGRPLIPAFADALFREFGQGDFPSLG